MTRIITAGAVGAIVYFIWGMMAWMAVPLHDSSVHALPGERAVVTTLQDQNLSSGFYVAPYASSSEEMGDPDSEFMKNHTAGPILTLVYRKDGAAPMGPSMLLGGFVLDLLSAMLAACLLSSIGPCGRSYWCRVGFVAGLGVFVALVGHMAYWNWMYFPLDYTIAFVVDVVVGWTLAGLAIAALIKPQEIAVSPAQPTEVAVPEPQAVPTAEPVRPVRNDAISLLASLQREARFIDIVKEPLGDYSDAQVGAAARDVLRDCGTVLDRLFKLQPIVDKQEGETVEIPTNADAASYRIAGDNSAATSGALVHHGWKAEQCELPTWTGSKESALIVAPAELDAK